MRTKRIIFVFSLLICAGCVSVQQPNENAKEALPASTPQSRPPAPKQTPAADVDLQNEVAVIASEVNGKVGVYAELIAPGPHKSISLRENDQFPMQSVVKVPISMAVLKMVDDGKLRLDQLVGVQESDMTVANQRSPIRDANPTGTQTTVEELLKAAVSESDGTASDVLQRIAGGAGGVQRYLESLGVIDMKIAWSHKEFGQEWSRQYENFATPKGTVELLKDLLSGEGVSQAKSDLLLKFMTESNNPDNRLLGMLPKETPVAHKTGTGGTQGGVTSAINDVGIMTLPDGSRIVIAVYIQDSKSDRANPSETIAKIAKAVFDKWSGAPKSEPAKAANFNERHTIN